MSTESNDLIGMMRERVQTYVARESWDEAESSASTTLETIQSRYEADPSLVGDYARALEIRADLLRDKGDIMDAQDQYYQIVDLLRDTADYPRVCGRVGANLALILEDQQETSEAVNYYIWALENLNLADPAMPLEKAGVLNNLAYIYEENQQLTEAESHFMEALAINKEVLGTNHESTADVWNNLGGLYYRSGQYAQSLEMHKSALEIRTAVLGPNHPDTSQSHGNLALAYAALDDIEAAKTSFDEALKILEKSKDADLHNYAVVSSNFVHILRELGHPKDAERIEKRTAKFMKKH